MKYMKKLIFLSLFVFVSIFRINAQTGVWSGALEVQDTKIPLVFHLDDEKPTLDSPAQGVKGMPIQLVRVESDSISINIPKIGATYNGKCKGTEIIGKFTQWGMTLPLILHSGDTTFHRPQTPKPPFPYQQEEVSFSNGEAVLKGTLTLPEGYNSETPVVIMVTGSGLQNRDEEIYEHKPFAVIADALARNGIASLRYDDRGFAESTGDVVNCTTEDLMNDALAGIDLLRRKFNKVGVLGHSEGGSIALLLGADKKADFIVSLAGMVISGKETLMDQNRSAFNHTYYPQEVVDEYCDLISSIFDSDATASEKLEKSNLPAELKQNLKAVVQQMKSPYMQYFVALDPSKILGDIKCPVLALNGTNDTQVCYKKNLEALNKGLPKNDLNKTVVLNGLNHLFQHCETGALSEYALIEETISPEVLTLITDFIRLQK